MSLRVLSLCSGYGGLEMALRLAGWPVELVAVADSDPGASRILAHHHPDVPNLGDITAVDWADVPPVDVITAGFPCQDVSLAGRGDGLIADRWQVPPGVGEMPCGCFPMNHKVWCEEVSPLGWSPAGGRTDDEASAAVDLLNDRDRTSHPEWLVKGTRTGVWAYVRNAIERLRPKFVLLENVRGLLSARAHSDVEPCSWCLGDESDESSLRALGAVLGDLANLGFDAEWTCLPASAVGAPHRRERVFILAWPADAAGDARRLLNGDSRCPAAGGEADGLSLLPTPNAALGRGTGFPSPATAQDRVDRGKRFLDDAVALLPTPAARDAERGFGYGDQPGRPLSETIARLLPTPTASEATGAGHAADGGRNLRTEVALLPTPRATDGTKGGPNQRGSSGDLMLPSAVMLLPTPKRSDGDRRDCPAERGRRSPGLVSVEALLPTPMAADGGLDRGSSAGYGLRNTSREIPDRWGEYAQAIARWETAIGRPAPNPTEPGAKGQPRLSPLFVEWLMGLPEGHITGVPGLKRNDQLRAGGNGVVPQQAAAALRILASRMSSGVAA